ncbi:MAG: 30S ribosomal protein S13 [Candidatus Moranbacteria bacterium]|nr:30S ribosomal protein S13 [Candidatus Moranbacteria bacterium]
MTVRIARVTIPEEKRAEIALTYIYGIGKSSANQILAKHKIDKNKKIKDLSEVDINALRQEIENTYTLEGELKRQKQMNIKRLKEISSYRGTRHQNGLPLRGQRTKTNAQTAKKFRKRR